MTSTVETVELPGIGTRSVFATNSGIEVGVVSHNSGERELLVYAKDDPDRCASVMKLDPVEAQTMADLLGVREETEPGLHIGGTAVRMATLAAGSPYSGRSLAATEFGVTVVAVLRNESPLPTPDVLLSPGDVVIVAGPNEAVDNAIVQLESGP